ncbi:MAG: hypothetical protein ABW024_09675 [Microbacterium sp.]
MTLTSILPTLRHSIPSPFTRDLWPARAVPTLDDVIVAGVSILRFVELCGTPCVTTGAAVLPISGGMASATDSATILTMSVVAVDERTPTPVMVLDGVLGTVVPVWSEARLLGRISSARERRFTIRDADGRDLTGVTVILPGDLRAEDLVTVPCPGAHSVGEVR